jgi:hypothetical protein
MAENGGFGRLFTLCFHEHLVGFIADILVVPITIFVCPTETPRNLDGYNTRQHIYCLAPAFSANADSMAIYGSDLDVDKIGGALL